MKIPLPGQGRSILKRIARRVMFERGMATDFPVQALTELDAIDGAATSKDSETQDLRNLPWCSIDNDDSRDLDQLTVAEALPAGGTKILVAIADVDAVVKMPSALDDHARQNTTSVYTVAETFPMLPEKLSTGLTALNLREDRLSVVVEMIFTADGALQTSEVFRAIVRNQPS
jgi:exoribonuclease R